MAVRLWTFLMLCAVLLSASEEVALIKTTQGEVSVKRGSEILAVKKGDVLLEHDVIQTGEKGMMGLSFNDGTLISVGAKSIFSVDAYLFAPAQKKFVFDVMLHKGTAAFESGRIGKLAPQKVRFKTTQGIIGIRGTKFVVEVE